MSHKVLLVDDEPIVTRALKRMLLGEPYNVLSTNSAQKALAIMQAEDIDVVVTDEKMPAMSGNEFLAIIRRDYPDTVRIVLTGNAEIETATRAINDGDVYRFLIKPCVGLDLAITLRRAIRYKELLSKTRCLLKITSQQFALLQELERIQPGITKVGKDIINIKLKSTQENDFDALMEEIDEKLIKSEIFLEGACQEPVTTVKND
ncbi:response regulator [Planctomycetota bacterium]